MGISKTIAITGANGYLGSKLLDYIIDNSDWNIVAFSNKTVQYPDKYSSRVRNIPNSELEQFLSSSDVDILIHFAFSRRFSSNNDIASSIDFSERVFNTVHNNRNCRLVNISTVGVYASTDDFLDETAPIGPDSLYGMAKYASEVILKSVFHNDPDRMVNLRLCGIAQSQRIIPVFIESAFKKHEINIVGGTQQFSWIDEEDAITAIYSLLKSEKQWKKTYNVSLNKERYSILDIANKVVQNQRVINMGGAVVNLTPQDIHLCVGWDSSSFIEDTGWSPHISIDDTIKKMIEKCWAEKYSSQGPAD